jgi:hydrogenase 3 maturation protease
VIPPETILKKKLLNAKRIAVMGVGSELRGDDIAGLLAAEQIEKSIKGKTAFPHSTHPDTPGFAQSKAEVRVFIGETAPENLTGEIKRYQPTHLIVIDAAELNKKPGHIEIMDLETIGGASFCTHSLPLKVIITYLLESFKFEVILIGIQPKSITFGAQPAKEVIAAVKKLAVAIIEALK